MQDYVKKYFWVGGIIVVVAAASLSARAANHVLAGTLLVDSDQPAEVAPAARPKRPTSARRSKRSAPIADRNMFCSDCVVEEEKPPEPADDTPTDAVPSTSLPLELLATNVSDKDEHSFATVRNTTSESQGAYWMGKDIPGAGPITRITGKYVDFRNTSSGRLERIALLDVKTTSKRSTPRPRPTATPSRPTTRRGQNDELSALIEQGVRKVSDDRYDIDRSLVDKVLANPMAVARGARVVPSVKDGKANGFKLYAIRPSSVYSKIGLRNGDTVTSINGFELSSPDKALEVYTKVREASNLQVTVLRRGQPVTMTYNIR